MICRLLVTFVVLLAATKILLVCCVENKNYTDHAMNLADYLKTIRHDPNVPPIKDADDTLDIHLRFLPSQLISLNGAKQEIILSAYLGVLWHEERLVWNQSAFGYITSTLIDNENIWYPRMVIFNGVGDKQDIHPAKKILLYSVDAKTTQASFIIRRDFSAGCTFDVTHFPNDLQTCEIHLYPLHTNTITQLNANNASLLLYDPSNEWTLVDVTTTVALRRKQPMFVCTLVYRRVYTYYMMNVVVPIVLLSFLQILVFFVPIESGEKMSLGITILLSFTVFLLLLDNIIPKSVHLPVISIFITTSMCLSASSLFLTSVILRLFHTPIERKMPCLVHAILVKGLGKLMLVNKKPATTVEQPVSNTIQLDTMDSNNISNSCNSQINASEIDLSTINMVSREQNPLPNPWIIAAIAMERLMLLLGFLLMIAMILGLIVPTFIKY